MNKVLTWEEYEAMSKDRPQPIEKTEKKIEQEKPVAIQDSRNEYVLMYPDNPINSPHNGEYIVGGVTLEIINGVVVTDKKSISDKLVNQGFLFLYTKEKEDE